ncbi:uncharacterized protein isoform X1 [Danio rerio]|uniref:Uncharacterized protein LOC553745 n=2 Tax=Danio rerio TaxID=7955 RepID=Q501T9_DANRE|nr:uncharacterized protein LOC553745 [Danio rerio]AAH95872.1 Zgc:113184 [Danio rerio]|eukprot:NP_001018552.1 uncharacterized protein LOC553745 [Danio rerio]
MEEAYAALYQEFVRLQSICLKQAAMLQHLSEALQRQQGSATASARNFVNPCQCAGKNTYQQTQCHESQRHPAGENLLEPQTTNYLGKIDEGLDKLHLNMDVLDQKQAVHDKAVFHNPAQMPASSAWDDLRKAEEQYYDNQTLQKLRRPGSSSFLDSELLSHAGGLIMSGVTLQSQVCEFCHAVFPGHTTTRGEFLRHLTTHMS